MDLPLFFTLPLIGGYAFVTGLFLLRWRSARQEAQRLYYRAAVWGVLLTLLAAIVHSTLLAWTVYRHGFDMLFDVLLRPLLTTRDATTPEGLVIRAHVALVCTLALLLGLGATVASQLVLRLAAGRGLRSGKLNRYLLERNYAAITDPLERLLARALLDGEAVQVTLNSGKVYVGYVLGALDPDLPTRFIKLQPLMSGQRNAEGQVRYTTFYDKILADFEADPATRAAVETFQTVLPVDKLVSLSGFDLDAYMHFLAENEGRDTDDGSDDDGAPTPS